MSTSYVSSSAFRISGAGLGDIPVLEIANVGMEATASDQVSGSKNGMIQRQSLPGPVKTLNPKITVAATESKAIHDWYNGINSYDKPKMDRKDLKLDMLDEEGKVAVTYHLKGCYPITFTLSTVKAGDSSQLQETIELIAEEVKRG